MPLSVRVDGQFVGGQPNNATASWWNDYYNLLTGLMQDQPVSVKHDLTLLAIGAAPTVAPTTALAAGTALSVGAYQYEYTWVDANGGETLPSPTASVTTTTNNQDVNLASIAAGPTGTTKRRVYRTKVGGSTFYLLTTLNDNTTTSYSDTTPDASLSTTTAPASASFGGTLTIKNAAGSVVSYADNAGNLTLQGSLYLGTAQVGLDSVNHWLNLTPPIPAGVGYGAQLLGWSGTATTVGFQVQPSGLAYLGTSRNGAVTLVPIYTGASTPSSPPTGSIWIKA